MRKEFPRQLSALGEVFAFLQDFGVAHGLPAPLLLELQVVLEELFTNQVRHARPGEGCIEIAIGLEAESVKIEVIDNGVDPFDPTAAPEVDTSKPVEDRTPGGLGIHFVRQTSDSFEWDYDPDRRRSRITITRKRER